MAGERQQKWVKFQDVDLGWAIMKVSWPITKVEALGAIFSSVA